jgi:hypothetical protein
MLPDYVIENVTGDVCSTHGGHKKCLKSFGWKIWKVEITW